MVCSGEQVAGLVQQRNLLAASLGRGASLPPMPDPRPCRGCFQLSNCTLLHKVRFCHVACLQKPLA